MHKLILIMVSLLIPLSAYAGNFSFEISFNTSIKEWCDDYDDCELHQIDEDTDIHIFPCGRRVRKHRVIYYNWDLDCYVYGPWYFGVALSGGCGCRHHHKICYVHRPSRHCHPHRTKRIYVRGRRHGHCNKTTVIHHGHSSPRRKHGAVIHTTPKRHRHSTTHVVKKRSIKRTSSGTIHHANSRGPVKKVTKSTKTNSRVIELGTGKVSYNSKRIRKW